MPRSLSIRNLDDALVSRLKQRAARHGRSTEAEVRDILRRAVAENGPASFAQLAAELRALTAGRAHTPSEILQREGREER